MTATKQTTRKTSGFSSAERAAMKERAAEVKTTGKGAQKKAAEAQACLDKIAEMGDADRVLAERLHAIVAEVAPELDAKTWYGMPAYARDGKIVLFFQPAEKFDYRYATLGFQDQANLDDGDLWPTSYAVRSLADREAATVAELVKRAVS